MKIRDYRMFFIDKLSVIYDPTEAESFFYLILEEKHQMKRIDLALNTELIFDDVQLEVWNDIVDKLEQQIPIQYILGTTSFYGLEFIVDENVLIPRPETEELVEWIISHNEKSVTTLKLKILDIGTGSGCIAISIAKNMPNAEVYAIDVSAGALVIAKKNATLNNVDIHFLQKDILQTVDLEQEFDVIVSNPPYVRNLEKIEIKKNVLDYEPHLALFVEDNDALVFYRKITELAQKNLVPNGQLYYEINQYLGSEMTGLLNQKGFGNIELRKDIYSNDRMLFGNKI